MRNLLKPASGLALLLCLGSVGLGPGCKSAIPTSRLDVTVGADATLGLDQIEIALSGASRSPTMRTFAVAPSGTPASAAPAVWQLLIPNVATSFTATITARGLKAGAELVRLDADVVIAPVSRDAVTLMLSAACRNMTCTHVDETCVAGTCQARPVFGMPDAGTGSDGSAAGDSGGDRAADARASDTSSGSDTGSDADTGVSSDTGNGSDTAGGSDAIIDRPPDADAGSSDGSCVTPPNTLASDPANCGACGHSCLGGACQSGACQPTRIAVLQPGNLVSLSMNSTTIFAVSVGRNDGMPIVAYAVAKSVAGTSAVTPTSIASFLSTGCSTCSTSLYALGTSDATLAWQVLTGSQAGASSDFWTCSATNCNATNTMVASVFPTVDTGYDPVNNRFVLHQATVDEVTFLMPGNATIQHFVPPMNLPYGSTMTVFGGDIYAQGTDSTVFSNNHGVIARVRADNNGAPTTLSANNPAGSPLAANSSALFFIGDGDSLAGYKLYRLPLPAGLGTSAAPAFTGATPALSQFYSPAVDDRAVYWITIAGQIVSCPPTGCSGGPTVVATGASAAAALIMDSQALYWLVPTVDASFNTIASSIFRLAR